MKDYKCTNVQGKVNPIIKEALDNYKPTKCRCRRDNCWYEDNIRGIVLNKNLDGFEYVGLYGEYKEAIPYPTCIVEEVQEGEDDGDW